MNRLFDDFNRGFDLSPFGFLGERLGNFNPSLNIENNEKDVRVTTELPGMDEKDINVWLAEGHLTIKGEKKNEREDKNGNYYRF